MDELESGLKFQARLDVEQVIFIRHASIHKRTESWSTRKGGFIASADVSLGLQVRPIILIRRI